MMVSTGGRERTEAEFDRLFEPAGWERTNIWSLSTSTRSDVEAKAVYPMIPVRRVPGITGGMVRDGEDSMCRNWREISRQIRVSLQNVS